MLKLSNGAKIFQYGEPNLFLMAGAHGDEIAPIIILKEIIKLQTKTNKYKNLWILPCLNLTGYKKKSRFCDGVELNSQYIPDTNVGFMLELQKIIKDAKPKIFVDMHEGLSADPNDSTDCVYIFSKFQNNDEQLEKRVFNFCKNNNIGLFYHPLIDNEYSIGCADTFAVENGAGNAYTTESFQLGNLDDRLKTNRMFVDFFLKEIT